MRNIQNKKIYVYGKHALTEALLNTPHVIKKVFLSPGLHDTELHKLIIKNNISVMMMTPGTEKIVGTDTAHQGVIALLDAPELLISFDEFCNTYSSNKSSDSKNSNKNKLAIAILAEVQDPHNVGAIIRSAAAFGLSAVLIPEHNQASITGTVVKASAGMVFRIPLVSIGNINHTIKVLKEKGFWIYGLAMDGTAELGTEKFDAPSAFIVGNEGTGIREKTREACDITLSVPMHPRTESLNAAVSAAVVFYEWSRKHPEALHPESL